MPTLTDILTLANAALTHAYHGTPGAIDLYNDLMDRYESRLRSEGREK